MRLIAILVALLIVGFLAYKQIGTSPVEQDQKAPDVSGQQPPKVPTNPNELKQFDEQMDDFMKEAAAKREAEILEAESQ